MNEKCAIKRLTRSDLTFFKNLFETLNAGNQKAINLNANIFIDQLYPSLPTITRAEGNEVLLALSIFGPGREGEQRLIRKVIKGDAYKNWRLNGEFIFGPEGNESRYDTLTPGDYAIFIFSGDPKPASARMLLVSATNTDDAMLHEKISDFVGQRSMIQVTKSELSNICDATKLPLGHPLSDIFIDEALEDAAYGGDLGVTALIARPSGTRLTKFQLEKARHEASKNGESGEELVFAYLNGLRSSGQLADVSWTSRDNAIAPYDFSIGSKNKTILVEVKSTAYGFERPLHISFNELKVAIHANDRYDVYRVYEMNETSGFLRVFENFGPFAQSILSTLEGLPNGVVPDSFSLSPEILQFGPAIQIQLPEEVEE